MVQKTTNQHLMFEQECFWWLSASEIEESAPLKDTWVIRNLQYLMGGEIRHSVLWPPTVAALRSYMLTVFLCGENRDATDNAANMTAVGNDIEKVAKSLLMGIRIPI